MLINWDFFDPLGRGLGALGAPCLCHFSLLRQRKVTKRKATPTRRAVLSGRHVVAGFSAWPPPTLRHWPTPDGARASHERAPTLRSVPAAVGLVRVRCRTGGRLWRISLVERKIFIPLYQQIPPRLSTMRTRAELFLYPHEIHQTPAFH